jgi:hypothetical protein
LGLNSKLIVCKKLYGKLIIYFAADLFFQNFPKNSLHPNKMNGINRKMTVMPNAKGMLSRAINTVTRPYADATATTLEMVTQVSSSNFSFINDDGELLPCPAPWPWETV